MISAAPVPCTRRSLTSGIGPTRRSVLGIAHVEGTALVLRSPTGGSDSALELLAPAAQDATALVFGDAPRFDSGDGAAPAQLTGPDVSAGLDLRGASQLSVTIDGDETIVDCAGENPAATRAR